MYLMRFSCECHSAIMVYSGKMVMERSHVDPISLLYRIL